MSLYVFITSYLLNTGKLTLPCIYGTARAAKFMAGHAAQRPL